MAEKRSKESLNTAPAVELIYLTLLYNIQRNGKKGGPRGVTPDNMAYTPQIEWIVAEMEKKFPNSTLWSGDLGRQRICRTLMRLRKAKMLEAAERKSKNPLILPDFPADLDAHEEDEEILEVSPDGPNDA